MKQNIYDHPDFFSGYKNLRDNDSGLNGLLERPAMWRLLMPVKGKKVLDIGCGLGHQLQDLLDAGADKVVGIDISKKMTDEARKRISSPHAEIICFAAEDYVMENRTFDIIVSSMTMHYVENLEALFKKIYNGLNKGGQFVFSIEHPICTASPNAWKRDEKTGYWMLHSYGEEGIRRQHWFVDDVIKHHRKLSTIMNTLLKTGFMINGTEEPTLDVQTVKERPELQLHLDRPAIMVISTIK